MLNADKVKLLTKVNLYKEQENRQTVKQNKYFGKKKSPKWVLQILPFALVSLVGIYVLVFAAFSDWETLYDSTLKIVLIIAIAVIIGAILLLLYFKLLKKFFENEYEKNRRSEREYKLNKQRLENFNADEEKNQPQF